MNFAWEKSPDTGTAARAQPSIRADALSVCPALRFPRLVLAHTRSEDAVAGQGWDPRAMAPVCDPTVMAQTWPGELVQGGL